MAHILILEPDRLLAGSLKAYFANANHTVSTHSDPQAALLAADKQRPDVIIAELQLAGRSGVEFLYEFRSYADWQAVPVVIFTNLHPNQIAGYQAVIKDLNISWCLYKTQNGLAELLGAVESLLPIHAKV